MAGWITAAILVLVVLAVGYLLWKDAQKQHDDPGSKKEKAKPHHLARRKKPLRHGGRKVPA